MIAVSVLRRNKRATWAEEFRDTESKSEGDGGSGEDGGCHKELTSRRRCSLGSSSNPFLCSQPHPQTTTRNITTDRAMGELLEFVLQHEQFRKYPLPPTIIPSSRLTCRAELAYPLSIPTSATSKQRTRTASTQTSLPGKLSSPTRVDTGRSAMPRIS